MIRERERERERDEALNSLPIALSKGEKNMKGKRYVRCECGAVVGLFKSPTGGQICKCGRDLRFAEQASIKEWKAQHTIWKDPVDMQIFKEEIGEIIAPNKIKSSRGTTLCGDLY